MVFNRRTYPNFCKLLELLEIPSQPSDMSFSVRCGKDGPGVSGKFARRTVRPAAELPPPVILADASRHCPIQPCGMKSAASGELKGWPNCWRIRPRVRSGKPICRPVSCPDGVRDLVEQSASDSRFSGRLHDRFLCQSWADATARSSAVADHRRWLAELCGSIAGTDSGSGSPALSGCFGRSHRRRRDRHAGEWTARAFDEVVFASHADQTLKMLADATRCRATDSWRLPLSAE